MTCKKYCDIHNLSGVATSYFNSVSALLAHISDDAAIEQASGYFGERSRNAAKIGLAFGDDALTRRADALLGLLEGAVTLETPRYERRLNVTGALPVVPAYLAGTPLNMVERRRVPSEQGEIAVFVNMATPHYVDSATIERRGAACAALARLLGITRRVSLYLTHMDATNRQGCLVKLDPNQFGQTAFALASEDCIRGAVFRGVYQYGAMQGQSERYTKELCAVTGASDFVITPNLWNVARSQSPFKNDEAAAQWIRESLEQHGAS